MSRLRAFAAFLYDFVVGDDPWIAAAVVASLIATLALSGAGVAAWWLVPVAALGALAASVWRGAR